MTGNGTAVVPWAYALVGGLFYGGIGAGIAYADGEFANDPIFALTDRTRRRAGPCSRRRKRQLPIRGL